MAFTLFLWVLVFCVSLFFLIKSSDFFIRSAERIGHFLGIPPFIIGVTIVAVGTSLPELFSSLVAVINGVPEVVVGNVVGSNITNIFLILGLAAVVSKKITLDYEVIHIDLPLMVSSAFFLLFTLWDGVFSFFDSLLAVFGAAIFVFYVVKIERVHPEEEVKEEVKELSSVPKKRFPFVDLFLLLVSGVVLFFSSDFLIDSLTNLASLLGVSPDIIAVSALAFGTSVPELSVSLSAAFKGKHDVAAGNVLGSNIFNSLFVMGIPGLFSSLPVSSFMLSFALPLMVAATITYFFMTQDKQVTRWEGWFLLLFYLLFLFKIFGLV